MLVGPETKLRPFKFAQGKWVVKPDELVGKRGKQGLVKTGNWGEIRAFLDEYRGREMEIDGVKDRLEYFLIEPYVEHEEEWFVAIRSRAEGDEILWSKQGGVEVEKQKPESILVPLGKEYKGQWRDLYRKFVELDFTSLEINPLAKVGNKFVPLDVKARLDDAARFWHLGDWGEIEFPTPWGRRKLAEEEIVEALDEKSGASLKLTILNTKGKLWLLLAGGGGSIVYTDAAAELGQGKELANYGEYSGNPSTEEMYQYVKLFLRVMLKEGREVKGKKLLIGGAVANFTDVAKTFQGMIRALNEVSEELKRQEIEILVRRGGPNYEAGLAMMKKFGQESGIKTRVFGPETAMTKIINVCLR